MIEELNSAREQFETALDRYISQCSSTQLYPSLQNTTRDVSLQQVDAEVAMIKSYESKLREARRIIGEARNYSLKLIPINSLPSEILLRIFELFMAGHNCYLKETDQSTAEEPFIIYPSCLTHVCSLWRKIVIESPSLWVHIDLAISEKLDPLGAQVDRVRTYATRSGKLPLQIHIEERETLTSLFDEIFVNNILHSLVGRMGGLDFTIHAELGRFQSSVLSTVISCCTPQIFNRLVINSIQNHRNTVIISTDDTNVETHEIYGYLQVSLSPNDLERSLSHLSILHLTGLFPSWTSAAYHGLVDLRLTSSHAFFRSSIKETELVDILRASPALKILYLQLSVSHRLPVTIPITPVPLEHLEVLSVVIDDFPLRDEEDMPVEAGELLRYFAPGSLPLRFTFQTVDYTNDRSFEEVKKFFMRSNIVRFCSRDAYPPLDELLSHAPNLRTLVFQDCEKRKNSMDLVSQANQNATLHLDWDSWHIQHCWTDIDDLSIIVRLYPGKLVLADCNVYRYPPRSKDHEEIPEGELSDMFPSVRFISDEDRRGLPDPTNGWDILD